MGPLKNIRHEKFVMALLEGKGPTEAYAAAGFKRDDANASRLYRNPKVAERLAELRNEIASKIPITIESLIGELEEARQHANGKNQFAASIKAILGKAQLAGLLIERQKVEVGDPGSFDGMTDNGQVSFKAIDQMFKFSFEPYHDYTEEDRQRLADMFMECMGRFSELSDKLVAEIRARPMRASYKPLPCRTAIHPTATNRSSP